MNKIFTLVFIDENNNCNLRIAMILQFCALKRRTFWKENPNRFQKTKVKILYNRTFTARKFFNPRIVFCSVFNITDVQKRPVVHLKYLAFVRQLELKQQQFSIDTFKMAAKKNLKTYKPFKS